MGRAKKAGASKDASANTSDESAVKSDHPKTATGEKPTSSATTKPNIEVPQKRRRSERPKPILVKRRAPGTSAMLQAEGSGDRSSKTIAANKIQQQLNTSPSDEDDDIELMSDGGEVRYRSGDSNQFALHSTESSSEEEEIEVENAQSIINDLNAEIASIKKKMEPYLQLLKKKQEANREKEAELRKKLAEEKKQKQLQREQQQQQQQQNQQQQPQQQQIQAAPNKQVAPKQQTVSQQQQKQPPRPNTGAAQPGPSTSGAPKPSAAAAPQRTAAPIAAPAAASAAVPTEAPPAASTSAAAKQQQQQHQKQPQPKSEKVPPIRTYKVDLQDVKQVCKSATGSNFVIKIINEKQKRYSVQCFTLAEYKLVKECLKTATAEFFSFTPRSEKPKTVLLKGISSCTEPEELLAELRQNASDDLEFIGVKPFTTVKSRREGHKLPIFIVTLSPQSRLESLRKITVLDYQVIHWEKLMRHDDMLQCMRCQRFGHAAANCEMQLRCVKCAETHNRGECRLGTERVEDMTQLKCVICGNEGHPANYRGCPKVQEIRDKQASQKAAESRPVRQAPTTNSLVRPGVSYARSAKGMGKARQAPPPVAPQAQVPKAPEAQPDILSLLLSIQGQLAGLQSQIVEQAGRVDKLYSMMAGPAQIQG